MLGAARRLRSHGKSYPGAMAAAFVAALVAVVVAIVVAALIEGCSASWNAPLPVTPVEGNPCGPIGVVCPGRECCSEGEVCGGTVGCPAGSCCYVGEDDAMRARKADSAR